MIKAVSRVIPPKRFYRLDSRYQQTDTKKFGEGSHQKLGCCSTTVKRMLFKVEQLLRRGGMFSSFETQQSLVPAAKNHE
jgi:hypothetical protein